MNSKLNDDHRSQEQLKIRNDNLKTNFGHQDQKDKIN
jgi:hypothetical protein